MKTPTLFRPHHRSLPDPLRRTLYLRRRPLAAACAFVAVLAALMALSPTPARLVPVYAAASDLPAGTVLTDQHLRAVELAEGVVPGGAARAASEVVGRTLAGPVTEGSVLTTASVSTGQRLARPGHVVASLPLPSGGIAELVRPGVRLDVLDASGAAIASDVPVIAPPDTPGSATGFGVGSTARAALVEVPVEVAGKLASLGGTSVTIVVR